MYELFFVIGLTMLIGFLAMLFAERTRVSQVLTLMLFGFLLGPVFHVVDTSPDSIVVSILPFIAILTLIVLLFDAGLTIDLFSVARAIPRSTAFTLLVFLLGVVLVTLFSLLVLGWPLLHGMLLGAVAGGTSSAIVIAMVEKTHISKEMKSLLTVESTLTDALCIIVAVIVIQLLLTNITPQAGAVVNVLLSSFSIAALLGVVCAFLWITAIYRFSLSKYSYMLTLALVFGLYAMSEAVQANGGFAVFVFGMVLGNVGELGRLLRFRRHLTVSPIIRLFQEEITFFVRTFFFVYVGLLLSPAYFTPFVLSVSLAILVIFVISRWAGQKLVLSDLPKKDRAIAVVMLPRGLAAAVLATMPLSSGISIAGFQQLVFGVILLSNIAATLGLFVFDRPPKKKSKPEEELEEALEGEEESGTKEAAEAGKEDVEARGVEESKEEELSPPPAP